jgi:hypothetical protein
MKLFRLFGRVVVVLLAMGGIRLDKLRPIRTALVLINFLFLAWMYRNATFSTALIYFTVVFSLRYLFLFGSFINNGVAERLTRRYGEIRGYEIYEAITASMFFHGGACFTCLAKTAPWMGLTFASIPKPALADLGLILTIVGTTVNVWSALIIGVDVYYYKDLYLGRFLGEFKQSGPYRYLKNPMYGVGQFAAYGTALTNLSFAGLLATGLNQAMMYIFYFTIEKPHIRKMIARSEQPSNGTVFELDPGRPAEG